MTLLVEQVDLAEDLRYQKLDQIALFFQGNTEVINVLGRKTTPIPLEEFIDMTLEQLCQKLLRAINPQKAMCCNVWGVA